VGVIGQLLLVTGMVLSPMLWPQTIPPATFTMLAPDAPAGRATKGNPEAKHRVHAAERRAFHPTGLYHPVTVPSTIQILHDMPTDANNGFAGDPTGAIGGAPNGSTDGPLGTLLQAGQDVPRAVPRAEPARPVATAVQRVKQGGLVQPPRLVYRVEPRYPAIARTARIEGVVRLSGVITTGGRIAELAVESGNPLLIPAAMDAVRQWRYEPTLLNGVPVEVMTTIVVTFTLSR
jgi:protein TonB